jgi:secreted Zn-dependent insulinase-like peptidase
LLLLLCSWASAAPSPEISLPPRNDYLPADFQLRCEQQPDGAQANGTHAAGAGGSAPSGGQDGDPAASTPDSAAFPSPPTLLLDAPGLRLWHKLDSSFRQPRTSAYLRLWSAAAYASPRAAALSHLLIKLLEDALCETAYLAEVAGLHYGIW